MDSLGKADVASLLRIIPAAAPLAQPGAEHACKHAGRCDLQAVGLKVTCKVKKGGRSGACACLQVVFPAKLCG